MGIAERRQEQPPGLIRAIRGDLDWITMKALEKDRTRRYATANGLALDIQQQFFRREDLRVMQGAKHAFAIWKEQSIAHIKEQCLDRHERSLKANYPAAPNSCFALSFIPCPKSNTTST